MADIKTQPPASFVVVQSNPQARSLPPSAQLLPCPPLPLPAAAASCRRLLLPLLLLLHNFRQSTSVCACLLVAALVWVCSLSSFRSLFRSLLPFSPSLYCSLSAALSLSVAALVTFAATALSLALGVAAARSATCCVFVLVSQRPKTKDKRARGRGSRGRRARGSSVGKTEKKQRQFAKRN